MEVWVLRPDVFGAVTKPQLCSEHVGTCTCGGSTLNLRQIVFRVLCTHNFWRAFMQGGGNLFQCAYKCGSHALK